MALNREQAMRTMENIRAAVDGEVDLGWTPIEHWADNGSLTVAGIIHTGFRNRRKLVKELTSRGFRRESGQDPFDPDCDYVIAQGASRVAVLVDLDVSSMDEKPCYRLAVGVEGVDGGRPATGV